MEHEQIERINELARKKKTVGLTAEEAQEQARPARAIPQGIPCQHGRRA